MSVLILRKESDIKKAAERRVERAKVRNFNNDFFSELDFINESEESLKLFIDRKDNFLLKILYKITSFTPLLDEKKLNEQYTKFFYERLFSRLKDNLIIMEVDRLHNLYLEGNLKITLRDIEHILNSKEIIIYLHKKNMYNKEFFHEISRRLENKELSDMNDYGNGRIKKIKRDLKEVL